MIPNKKKREAARFSIPNLVAILAVAALIVGADRGFALPSPVQGDSGMLMTALLILAIGRLRYRGTATLIGIIAGMIAAIVDPAQRGIFYTVLTFGALGIGAEIGSQIMGAIRRIDTAMFIAAISNLFQFVVKWLYSVIMAEPLPVIASTVPMTAIQHVIFGLIGGLLGFGMLYLLERLEQSSH